MIIHGNNLKGINMAKNYLMKLNKIVDNDDVYIDALLASPDIDNIKTIQVAPDEYLYVQKSTRDGCNGVFLYMAISDTDDVLVIQGNDVAQKPLADGETNIHQSAFVYIFDNNIIFCAEHNMSIYWVKRYIAEIFSDKNCSIKPHYDPNALSKIKNIKSISLTGVQELRTGDERIQRLLRQTKANTPEELFSKYEIGISLKIKRRTFRKRLELQREAEAKQAEVDASVKNYLEELDIAENQYVVRFGNNQSISNNNLCIKKRIHMDIMPNFEQKKDNMFNRLVSWKRELNQDNII